MIDCSKNQVRAHQDTSILYLCTYLCVNLSERVRQSKKITCTHISSLYQKENTQVMSSSSKVKHFITYNAEIEVASVEVRPL